MHGVLRPHSQATGEMAWQLVRVQTVIPLPESWQYQSNFRSRHMTTVNPNCIIHWTVAVTPIPLH